MCNPQLTLRRGEALIEDGWMDAEVRVCVCVSQTGDRILSINDVSLEGMTHTQAGVLLKNITGSVSLQVGGRKMALKLPWLFGLRLTQP